MTKKHSEHQAIKRNIHILTLISFFVYFLPYGPVAIIIFEKLTGSYVEAMSVFALMSLTTAFLEIPTGVVSDKWGRKKTLTIGCFLSFLNVAALALALHSNYSLWFLYAAALLQGAAGALYSGNNEALIYETLKTLRISHAFPKTMGRMSSMTQGGLALSGLLAGLILFSGFSHDILIYVSLVTCFILVILCLFIIEPPRDIPVDTHPIRHIIEALNRIKRNDKLKLYSLTNMLQMGGGSASYYFIPSFIGLVWPSWAVPIFRTIQHMFGSVGYWHAGTFVKRFGAVRSLIGVPLIANSISMVAFWISSLFSPFILFVSEFSLSTWYTAKSTIEQESFSKSQRATMGSLINMGASIIAAALCLIMGWMADHMSLGMTLFIVLAVRSIIVSTSYAAIYRKHK